MEGRPSQPAPLAARVVLWCGLIAGALTFAVLCLAWVVPVGEDPNSFFWGELPWVLVQWLGLAVAVLVIRRAPGNRVSTYFVVMIAASSVVSLLGYVELLLRGTTSSPWLVGGVVLTGQIANVGSTVSAAFLLTVFPDGTIERPAERWAQRFALTALLAPPVLFVLSPEVPQPWWADRAPLSSPVNLPGLSLDPSAVSTLSEMPTVVIIPALLLLFLRYRRSAPARRARIRWIFVPIVPAVFLALSFAVLRPPGLLTVIVFLLVMAGTYVAITLAILQPEGIDPDKVLRRTVVYGVLWLIVTALWAGLAVLVGETVGNALTVEWAPILTMAAAVLFEPTRRRLAAAADRWVFGRRRRGTEVVAELGATLAATYDIESLLPSVARTLESGLGLDWARVRLTGAERPETDALGAPALTVPVTLSGDQVGVVECGPRRGGPLTDEEVELVTVFAHQAALALRNVRLAQELGDQAEKLAASRTRLVRAQQTERRRIERNIHDGVQQDLVALISKAGRAQRLLTQEPARADTELAAVQEGLQRVLNDLRELARGIHPSLLTDHGLLVAVEALASRSPIPTRVRADIALKDSRFTEDVEGAAYFTVAEAVTNSLKHSAANQILVSLARENGSLLIEVSDNGVGMADPQGALAALGERIDALGGDLEVASELNVGTVIRTRLSVGGAR